MKLTRKNIILMTITILMSIILWTSINLTIDHPKSIINWTLLAVSAIWLVLVAWANNGFKWEE